MSDSDLRVLQEFPGGTQTFGLVASGDSVFYGDAQGRTIGRIEPSGARTVLRLPASEGRPHGLAAAGDDALWIAEWSNGTGNRLSRVQVDGTAYDFLDLDGYGTPRNIVVAGDDLFFTIGSRLGRLCWPTHRIDVLSFPGETGWRHVESTPLAADPAGGIWIGFGGATGFIARFDLQEETWQSFEIPGLQPTGLVVGRGDEVWFTDFAHNQVGRLTVDREVEVWDRQGNPFGVAVNSSGDVWITEFSTGRLTRLDGSSGAHVESVDLPTPGCQPQNLTFDAHGALWYTGQTGVVGRFGVAMEMPDLGASSELVVRPPPVRLRDLTPTGRDLLTDLSPDATALRISISDHPSFASPPSEVTIWRYVDLPKLVAMLATRSLFFARLDTQPDPFEGSLPQRDGSDLNLDEITPAEPVKPGETA